jgi:hypothetical protein
MKNNNIRFILVLSLAALTLFACTLSASTETAVPQGLVETTVAETLQAVTPQASPTIAIPATDTPALATVTSASAPTNTSAPSGSNGTRINFATGATSGLQEGRLGAGQSQRFLVGAAAGQPMLVSVDSLNNDVTFSVTGAQDGKVLLSAAEKTSSWQTMLTKTQDYLIEVYAGASTENFTLNVITPARIQFEPGAVSAKLTGSTPGGLNVAYVLRANAGQKMKLTLSAPKGNAVLSMYGYQDGQPYLRYVVEQTNFEFTLPATQDYIIQVVPRGGEVADYTLTVEIR